MLLVFDGTKKKPHSIPRQRKVFPDMIYSIKKEVESGRPIFKSKGQSVVPPKNVDLVDDRKVRFRVSAPRIK